MPPLYFDTSGRILSEIQRHLLETTIDLGVTWSSLWTSAEVLNYLNNRISRFMRETHIITVLDTTIASAGVPLVALPVDLIAVKYVRWKDSLGNYSNLSPMDLWMADHTLAANWQQVPVSTSPYGYILEPETPLQLRMVPRSSMTGEIHIDWVQEHTPITITSGPMPIPCMFSPYIIAGVLQDMLAKEGEANDPERAAYFGTRWDEGIEAAKAMVE